MIQTLESRQFMSATPAMDLAPAADTPPAITVEADRGATARRMAGTTTTLQSPSHSLVVISIIAVLIG